MRNLWSSLVKFFVSLRLTVVLLALSIVLVFVATLAETRLGVWGVHQGYFHTFIVWEAFKGVAVPVFPGGYVIGGLLFLNLVSAHLYRFKLTWRKLGIHLTHAGVVLLLLGELLSGLWQQEFQLRFGEGDTKNYAESPRDYELALLDTTDPKFDDVVAIPAELLERGQPLTLSNSQGQALPFRVLPRVYYPNADLRGPAQPPGELPGSQLANAGVGPKLSVTPLPVTSKDEEMNLPVASVELVGPDHSLGTWLVSPMLDAPMPDGSLPFPPQTVKDAAGHTWRLALRSTRDYEPFSLTLIKASHDVYPGTKIPKNFSSRVHLKSADGRDDSEKLIYMNAPLRYRGLTFYQQAMGENESVLEVVRNPSWQLPYISCLLVAGGLIFQFGLTLVNFISRRKATAASGS